MGAAETTMTRINRRAVQDPLGAARELGRALMRGNAAEFKQGYSAVNAHSAVSEMFKLDGQQTAELMTHLIGFGLGMAEDNDLVNPAGIR